MDHAFVELRTTARRSLDRRVLYADLSEALTRSLGRLHTGWCLNRARSVWGPPETEESAPASTVDHPLAAFIDDGLGGMERAVLQLEIGAGRDSATSRAALRLGPRQYQRHRSEGLGKLRDAVAGLASGLVCDDHLHAVTLAATGDREASAKLAAGADRCRSCAREARALGRVLNDRLAVAPWPLLIMPAGLVAAKLGAIGAALSGKTSGGGALSALGSSTGAGAAKGLAAVLATAAVATGGVAAAGLDSGGARDATPVATERPVPSQAAGTAAVAKAPAKPARGASKSERRKASRRAADRRAAKRRAGNTTATAPTTGTAPAASTGTTTSSPLADTVGSTVDSVGKTVDGVGKTVNDTVSGVGKTVDGVADKLPVLETQNGVPDLQGTLDEVTGTVDGLLAP